MKNLGRLFIGRASKNLCFAKQPLQVLKNSTKKKTGIDLPDLEAEVMVLDLLQFMRMVYKPIRKGEMKYEKS